MATSLPPSTRAILAALLLLALIKPTTSLNPLKAVKSRRHTSSLDPERYTSLDLTHVEFDSTDPLAQLLGFVTLTPIFLLCAYVTLVVHRRELLFLNAFVGQITCEWLNGHLKSIFKQERPTDRFGQGYGMPSSHSQFVGFFAAFFLSHYISFWPRRTRWVRSRATAKSVATNGGAELVQTDRVTLIYLIRSAENAVACGAIIVMAVLTAYSRYHLMYHSTPQILVGLALGTLIGLVWYHLTERLSRRSLFASLEAQAKGKKVRTPVRQMILDHPLAVALRVRDSYAVFTDGGIEAEYGSWRAGWETRREKQRAQQRAAEEEDEQKRADRMYRALALADKCEPTDSAFCVGCVVCPSPWAFEGLPDEVDAATLRGALATTSAGKLQTTSTDERLGLLVTGFSRELPGNTHAEESALLKIVELEKRQREKGDLPARPSSRVESSVTLDLDLYTTMEPCSERLSKKAACVQNILDFNAARHRLAVHGRPPPPLAGQRRRKPHGGGEMEERFVVELRIARVLQGVREPRDFVKCQGTRMLRELGGIEVLTVVDAHEGRIEREALRLAKKGHAHQPASRGDEEIWAEFRD